MTADLQKKKFIYKKEFYQNGNFYDGLLEDFSNEFFCARQRKGLSLDEVSLETGIPVSDIDGIETGLIDIDFETVEKLCEFYHCKIYFDKSCFPGLPDDLAEKCLAFN